MGLYSRPVGCLVSALEPAGCWVGPGLGDKMAASGRAHTNEYSQYLLHQCLCPQSEPQVLPPPQETLQVHQVGLAQASMKSLLFSLGPSVHETLCTFSKSGVSVSPGSVEFLQSGPAGLLSQMLWGPDMGLTTLTPVGEPLRYNYFPVCGPPTPQVWDFIVL